MANHGGPILGVLFDYGLVLTGPPDPSAYAKMLELLKTDESGLQGAYWRHRDAYDRGGFTGSAYWRAVAKDLGQVLSTDELRALIAADVALWTQPNQVMIDWALRLQGLGIRTGILSNLGDEMESGIRARLPWLGGFEHFTFSHRLGIAKPDAAIYRAAAEGMELLPEEILFVDDKLENILAARESDMSAVQYPSHADFLLEMQRLGLDTTLGL